MQPGDCAATTKLAEEDSTWCTKKRRRNGDHNIGSPTPLRKQGEQAGDCKAGKMEEALDSRWPARNPEWTSLYPNIINRLLMISITIISTNLPLGEIRRCRNAIDLMTTGHKPLTDLC
jgi:hypothetical protein